MGNSKFFVSFELCRESWAYGLVWVWEQKKSSCTPDLCRIRAHVPYATIDLESYHQWTKPVVGVVGTCMAEPEQGLCGLN